MFAAFDEDGVFAAFDDGGIGGVLGVNFALKPISPVFFLPSFDCIGTHTSLPGVFNNCPICTVAPPI